MKRQLGAHTRAILEALEAGGALTASQVGIAASVGYDSVRPYLARCVERGLATRSEAQPVRYSVVPGWREATAPRPPRVPRPAKQAQQARQAPAVELHSIWGGARQ